MRPILPVNPSVYRAIVETFCYGALCILVLLCLTAGSTEVAQFVASMFFLFCFGTVARVVVGLLRDIYRFLTEDHSLRG